MLSLNPSLRYYQADGVMALYDYFAEKSGNPLVVIPTAGGKSMTMGEFTRTAFQLYPHQRWMILTHVSELIEQDYQAVKRMWPEAPAGIYSASLGARDTMFPITVAGIQSVYSKPYLFNWIDIVLIDEAHLMSSNDGAMYGKFLAALRKVNPKLKVIGFTATPYRMKEGLLVEAGIFTDVAYEIGVKELVEGGFLAPLRSPDNVMQADLSGLKIAGGEFTRQSMEATMDKDELTEAALDEVFRYGADRKSWLFFCSGVDHADHVRTALLARGINTECITGKTPKTERAKILDDFKSGRIQAVTNCDVLTTGFDHPGLDLIALLRPTKSPGLYVQILGRGMRWIGGNREASYAAGKSDCLVLDFAGNIERFGPIDNIQIAKKRKKKDGELFLAPVKMCFNPDCRQPNPVQARFCKFCNYEFPASSIPPHEETASHAAVMSAPAVGFGPPPVETAKVDRIFYNEHVAKSGKTTLSVRYACGLKQHTEFIMFEHDGKPRYKAEAWWRDRLQGEPPKTVEEALKRIGESSLLIKEPTRIHLIPDPKDKKYKRIVGYEWH